MRKTKWILLATLCIGISAQAQKKNQEPDTKGISAATLAKIQKSFKNNAEDKALRNAMFSNDLSKLAQNSDNSTAFNTYFSNKVNSQAITDQKSSGRCWMFTGMNVLRSKAIRKHNLPATFQFSQVYTFFWDQLEKSNLFLQSIIDTRKLDFNDKTVEWLFKNPIGDGGQFTGVANLITKYGIMPADAMPETYSSEHTSQLSSLISLKLREFGLELREMSTKKGVNEKKLEQRKVEMLQTIYRMLALNFGVPPTEFTWTRKDAKGNPVETKTYTPKSFYEEFVDEDFSNYYMIMNDPTREYYKVYEIEYDRHVYDGQNWRYLNLPMDEIAEMAIASIKDSTMMYFSCDVAKFLDRTKGFMDVNNYDYASLMGTTFNMNKKQRVSTFASGSSHAMTLCAVDLDQNGKPIKWMVENSWGNKYGYNGFLIMTNEWFNEYMFRLVIEDKYMPAKTKALLDQKPIMLPAWDPMFLPEE
ncbi:MAG: C1 family peptidase [Bacteroidales bacterium]|nr:C1 family peptidase [Bacteroidales bacterium]